MTNAIGWKHGLLISEPASPWTLLCHQNTKDTLFTPLISRSQAKTANVQDGDSVVSASLSNVTRRLAFNSWIGTPRRCPYRVKKRSDSGIDSHYNLPASAAPSG